LEPKNSEELEPPNFDGGARDAEENFFGAPTGAAKKWWLRNTGTDLYRYLPRYLTA